MRDSLAPVIFARGGSKGVPKKNLTILDGRSLLHRTIEQAVGLGFEEVFVSTDSEEIAEEARRSCAIVPFIRPAELATDTSPEWLAWKHFCSYLEEQRPGKFSHLLVLPTTAPLRLEEDIVGVMSLISSGEWDLVVTMSPAHRHPQFNMVRQGVDGSVNLYDRPTETLSRRQDVEPVYDLTTVAYGATIDFVVKADDMWEGRTTGMVIPRERSLDIDTPLDVEVAEFLLERRSSGGR